MLELGLHFSSAMNSVSGLRFSIPYLTGRFPCRSPLLLSPFQVRPTSRSDYTGPVLLGFYYYWAFGLLSFYRFYRYRASRPLGFYRLCYFVFRTLGLCRTLCFRFYFILWNSSVDVDFQIFIYGYFRYLYLSNYFYYFESDGCHILVSELFTYRNILLCKSGCHNLVSERVPSRLRPGMAILETLVYSV